MRELTSDEIHALATRAEVRQLAVENFLGTMSPAIHWAAHIVNAFDDARFYGWNDATQTAVFDGIKLAWCDPEQSDSVVGAPGHGVS